MPVLQAIQATAGRVTAGGVSGTVMVATYDTNNLLSWNLQIDANPVTHANAIQSNMTLLGYNYSDASSGTVDQFNGTSSYLIGPPVNFLSSSEFAINIWFNPTTSNIQLLSELELQDPGSGYHYTMLEIDGSGHVRARVWPNNAGSALISANIVDYNTWNHVYFYQNAVGLTYLKLNDSMSPSVTNTTVRQPPGSGSSCFAIGLSDITNIGTFGRFSGLIGHFTFTNTSSGNSNYSTYQARFGR